MRVSLVFLVSIFYFWANISIALEESSYRVITVNEIYEIREYNDRLAVQTIQKNGQNGAFRKLFKYISGSNISATKIENDDASHTVDQNRYDHAGYAEVSRWRNDHEVFFAKKISTKNSTSAIK